jgi:hypothetical protein
MLKEHQEFWKKLLCKLQTSPGGKKEEKTSENLDILYADYGGYASFVEYCLKILLERIKKEGYVPNEDRPILNELLQTGNLPEEYRMKFAEIVSLYPETLNMKVAI